MSKSINGKCDIPDLIDDIDDDDDDDDDNEDNWLENEVTESLLDSQQVKCLFSENYYPTPKDYFVYLKQNYDFDIWNLVHVDLKLDFFGYVKLINFLRAQCNHFPPPSVAKLLELKPIWDNETFLKPIIANDSLLQFMIDDYDDDYDDCSSFDYDMKHVTETGDYINKDESVNEKSFNKLKEKLNNCEVKNKQLKYELKEACVTITKMKEFMNDVILTSDMYRPIAACRVKQDNLENEEYEDSGYFMTYSHHDIHAEMLQDKIRTVAYQNAILRNRDAFQDKIVLDVGCGTGILSMFAVNAGAKHVYAVDMSDIAYQAMDIVRENKMLDKITVIKSCIEEVDLPIEKVDIIISEWMGYFLLYESMLDSVLFAADKWLNHDGLLLPDEAKICLLGAHDENLLQSQIQYWNDVYGFRMSCIKSIAKREAYVHVIPSHTVVSDPVTVITFDIRHVKKKQLNYQSKFEITFTKTSQCSCIVAYFDISFTKGLSNPISFSTSPFSPATHWKQTIFFLEKPIFVTEGEKLSGFIDCHKNPHDPRSLIVHLTFAGMKHSYTVS